MIEGITALYIFMLAAFTGDLTYEGSLADVHGQVKLAAQKSRLATIYADRTRLDARYRLGLRAGTLTMLGGFAADSSTLDPSMIAGVVGPLKAASGTPIGPVATSIANALGRTANRFNIGGHITLVNFPGGGAARISGIRTMTSGISMILSRSASEASQKGRNRCRKGGPCL